MLDIKGHAGFSAQEKSWAQRLERTAAVALAVSEMTIYRSAEDTKVDRRAEQERRAEMTRANREYQDYRSKHRRVVPRVVKGDYYDEDTFERY